MPRDEKENCRSLFLEISAGVGGQEAMLFAQNLHLMYVKYANFRQWNLELTDFEETELGTILLYRNFIMLFIFSMLRCIFTNSQEV